jgi:hypothetical protein
MPFLRHHSRIALDARRLQVVPAIALGWALGWALKGSCSGRSARWHSAKDQLKVSALPFLVPAYSSTNEGHGERSCDSQKCGEDKALRLIFVAGRDELS